MSLSPFLSRSPGERFYHPELDVLRFFAFFFIFIHHSLPHDPEFYTKLGTGQWLAQIIAGIGAAGAFGVQLFFMLSSYLVTELIIRERALRSDVDLKAFFIRRMLRIWPLYFAFLAFAWVLQYFVPGQHIGWRAALAFIFLAGNWWIVFVGFPNSVIFPLWCISIEEQFYLFWPALMRRLSARGLMIAAGVLVAIANVVRWYLAARQTWESRIWCNTFTHLDSIGCGILLAVLLAGAAPRISALHRSALLLGGLACYGIAGSYFRIKYDPLTTSRVALGYPVALIGAVALFLATLRPRNADRKPGRAQRTFVYLGRISYGLYVFHILGLMLGERAVHDAYGTLGRYLLRNAVALAISIGLAAASYRFLETPFLSLKQRFTHVLSRPGG